MEKIRGNYVILNGKCESALYYESRADSAIVYEVIRLFPKGLMFPEDHFLRMQKSCHSSSISYPGNAIIKVQLETLLKVSEIQEGNVKIQLYKADGKTNIVCFFVPHHYPTEKEINEGVKLQSFAFERPHPHVKQWHETFRKEVRAYIRENKIYEAALLNKGGKYTEGSRSNLFFVDQKNRVITASENCVLGGISRKYVLEICKEKGVEVWEGLLSTNEAAHMKYAFLSGTSPLVLAVKNLDHITYDPDFNFVANIKQTLLNKAGV